jgi:hypothetical protein
MSSNFRAQIFSARLFGPMGFAGAAMVIDPRSTTILLASWFLAALAGCGSPPEEGGPPLYAAGGVVRFNSQPLADADVVFALTDGSRSSFGRTDAQGRFRLTTRNPDDGAPAGEYVVTITKFELPGSPPNAPQDSPHYNPYAGRDFASQPPPKALIPMRYAEAATSELKATVTPAGENQFEFNL